MSPLCGYEFRLSALTDSFLFRKRLSSLRPPALFLPWTYEEKSAGQMIDRPAKQSSDFLNFFINRHRPIGLQIRPINIQAHLQATRDAASCGKQFAIPLVQRITLIMSHFACKFFEERTTSAVITAPLDAPFNISLYHTAQLALMLTGS